MPRRVVGISEKRLNNKRFRKTEEAILRVFLNENINLNVTVMAKRIGVSRSTIYHHHRAINSIVVDYKRYIIKKYSRLLNKKIRNKKVKMDGVVLQMVLFVLQNKNVFEILFKSGEESVIREMLNKKKKTLMRHAGLRENENKVFMIYCGEVVELFREWGSNDFNEVEMNVLLENIVYLTNTMKKRLVEIN